MKLKIKSLLLLLLGCTAIGFSGVSFSHSLIGSVGGAADPDDNFHTTCFSHGNTVHRNAPVTVPVTVNGASLELVARIRKTAAAPAGSVTVTVLPAGTNNVRSTNTTVFSAFADSANNGNGIYNFKATASVAGSGYELEFHCQNALAQHTGTGDNFTGVPPNLLENVDFTQTN